MVLTRSYSFATASTFPDLLHKTDTHSCLMFNFAMGSSRANSNISSPGRYTANAAEPSRPLEEENHLSGPPSANRYNYSRPRNSSFPSQANNRSSGPNLNRNLTAAGNNETGEGEPATSDRPSSALASIGNVLRTGSFRTSRQRDPALRPRSRLSNLSSLWYGGDAARAARRLGLDWIWPNSGHPGASMHSQHSANMLGEGQTPNTVGQGPLSISHDDPPDGGALAWAHVLAGLIVCLNTQYVFFLSPLN